MLLISQTVNRVHQHGNELPFWGDASERWDCSGRGCRCQPPRSQCSLRPSCAPGSGPTARDPAVTKADPGPACGISGSLHRASHTVWSGYIFQAAPQASLKQILPGPGLGTAFCKGTPIRSAAQQGGDLGNGVAQQVGYGRGFSEQKARSISLKAPFQNDPQIAYLSQGHIFPTPSSRGTVPHGSLHWAGCTGARPGGRAGLAQDSPLREHGAWHWTCGPQASAQSASQEPRDVGTPLISVFRKEN